MNPWERGRIFAAMRPMYLVFANIEWRWPLFGQYRRRPYDWRIDG